MKYLLSLTLSFFLLQTLTAQKIRVLVVDGQNNHEMWPKTSVMMKQYLEESGLFEVDIRRTQYTWKGEKYLASFGLNRRKASEALNDPKVDSNFTPDFFDYDVVLTNFGWRAAAWPEQTQKNLEK